jgi:hypothetical protein
MVGVRELRETLAERLRVQAVHCATLGSPLYEGLLVRAAGDAIAGGPVWRLFEDRDAAPADSAPLAMMGAVHRLVLSGRAPGLAPWFASASIAAGALAGAWPAPDPEGAWPAFRAIVDGQRDEVAALLDHPSRRTRSVDRPRCWAGSSRSPSSGCRCAWRRSARARG